jgi:AcrR family transcriptional regulator
MMQAADNLINAFRELVATSSYDKITISDICAKAQISRKSFYAHYASKNDLLEQVFYTDIVKPLEDINALLPMTSVQSAPQLLTETIFKKIQESPLFYQNLFGYSDNEGSAIRDIAITLLTRQFSKLNLSILHFGSSNDEDAEYLSFYFAAAGVALISKWVREKMTLPPETLATIYLQSSLITKKLDK